LPEGLDRLNRRFAELGQDGEAGVEIEAERQVEEVVLGDVSR